MCGLLVILLIVTLKKKEKRKVKNVKKSENNFKGKNEETFKDISIKLKIEEKDSEVRVNSSWKNISSTDRKEFFSRVDFLISLFKKFNKKYGEKDVEIITEVYDGKTNVKAEIGDSKMEFIVDSTKERKVLLEISKITGISINRSNNVSEF